MEQLKAIGDRTAPALTTIKQNSYAKYYLVLTVALAVITAAGLLTAHYGFGVGPIVLFSHQITQITFGLTVGFLYVIGPVLYKLYMHLKKGDEKGPSSSRPSRLRSFDPSNPIFNGLPDEATVCNAINRSEYLEWNGVYITKSAKPGKVDIHHSRPNKNELVRAIFERRAGLIPSTGGPSYIPAANEETSSFTDEPSLPPSVAPSTTPSTPFRFPKMTQDDFFKAIGNILPPRHFSYFYNDDDSGALWVLLKTHDCLSIVAPANTPNIKKDRLNRALLITIPEGDENEAYLEDRYTPCEISMEEAQMHLQRVNAEAMSVPSSNPSLKIEDQMRLVRDQANLPQMDPKQFKAIFEKKLNPMSYSFFKDEKGQLKILYKISHSFTFFLDFPSPYMEESQGNLLIANGDGHRVPFTLQQFSKEDCSHR